MSLSAFVLEFYSQKEDEDESGAVLQAQPWKTRENEPVEDKSERQLGWICKK